MNNTISKAVKEFNVKNLANLWLINKVHNLPHCRRLIFEYKMLEWDLLISDISLKLLRGDCPDNYKITANERAYNTLKNEPTINNNFIDFFFAFHQTISLRFEKQILKILNSNMQVPAKIVSLMTLYRDLINLTRLELEGFEIDCSVLNSKYTCEGHQCKNQPNVITLMITPEYVEDTSIINSIVEVMERYIKPGEVTLVVDYTNLCRFVDYYSWEESNAYCRYTKCKKFVKDIYFYNTSCVDFGKYYDELKSKIINSKKELNEKIYGRKKKYS